MINKKQLILFFGLFLYAHASQEEKEVLNKKLNKKTKVVKKEQKTVWFRFKDEPLTKVINYLATEKGLNIMLPQGPDALKTTLTFELPHKISLDKAWHHLLTILDLSGYTLIVNEDFCTIVKNGKNINKEQLPLYVNVPTNDLPDSSLRIRYIKYLTNLQVPDSSSSSSGYSMGGSGGSGSLQAIFKDMLSKDSATDPAGLIFDSTLNAMIITDRSNIIRGIMTIVDVLESSSTQQTLKIIKLTHASATQLKSLFDELIAGSTTATSSAGYSASPTPSAPLIGGGYFEKSTKIVAESRTNSLILLGKSEALERIEKFIKSDLDVPLQSGQSVLHVYTLQHLNAQSFASILTSIVSNASGGGSSALGAGMYGSGTQQSTSTASAAGEQYFKGVIIAAEATESALQTSSYGVTSSYDTNFGGGSGGQTPTQGAQTGNRLIVAATRNDWIRLEKLIRQLDQPQRQVAIQGLIVDMTEVGQRQLGTQLCSKPSLMLKGIQGQSAQLTSIPTTNSIAPVGGGNPTPPTLQSNLANIDMTNFSKGSAAITISDPTTNDIWWITQIISSQSDSKILSQPFLFGTHNQTITFVDKSGRYIAGNTTVQQSTTVQNQDQVFAELNLTIVPRISENGMINLGITLNINQWTDDQSDTQITRLVVTNANIQSGDILILGGLNQTKVAHTVSKTPLLGDIPLLGNLFKSTNKTVTKSNLMVFLRPEIVKAHGGIDYFTAERFNDAVDSLFSGENFESLRDPISRWFFGDTPRKTSGKEYEKFKTIIDPILSDENLRYKPQSTEKDFLPIPKERKEKENHKGVALNIDKDTFEKQIEERIDQSKKTNNATVEKQQLSNQNHSKTISQNIPSLQHNQKESLRPQQTKNQFEKDIEQIVTPKIETAILESSLAGKPLTQEEIAAQELKDLFKNNPLTPLNAPSLQDKIAKQSTEQSFEKEAEQMIAPEVKDKIIESSLSESPLTEEEIAAQELKDLFKNNPPSPGQ